MPQFKQVDVFTTVKYKGNPVAVFFDADGLSDEEMAAMSAWTNLSEATFIQKPTTKDADYRVRIFSLDEELPFAGHPTIGTCFALLEAGAIKPKNGKLVQECKAGLVLLDVSGDTDVAILFTLPYAKHRALGEDEIASVISALGAKAAVNAAVYEVGPTWLTIQLESAQAVLDLQLDQAKVAAVSAKLGVTGFQIIGKHATSKTFETRTFAGEIGEDPVCGSGSGATGAFLRDYENVEGDIYLRQGTALNRAGRVTVSCADLVRVTGNAVTVIDGSY